MERVDSASIAADVFDMGEWLSCDIRSRNPLQSINLNPTEKSLFDILRSNFDEGTTSNA